LLNLESIKLFGGNTQLPKLSYYNVSEYITYLIIYLFISIINIFVSIWLKCVVEEEENTSDNLIFLFKKSILAASPIMAPRAAL